MNASHMASQFEPSVSALNRQRSGNSSHKMYSGTLPYFSLQVGRAIAPLLEDDSSAPLVDVELELAFVSRPEIALVVELLPPLVPPAPTGPVEVDGRWAGSSVVPAAVDVMPREPEFASTSGGTGEQPAAKITPIRIASLPMAPPR